MVVRCNGDISLAASFYDQETNILSVNILPFEPYDSYVESEDVRIDTDRNGRPVFIEVSRPQDEWHMESELALPVIGEAGILNLRETVRTFPTAEILCDQARKTVCLKFLARKGELVIRLADNMLAEIADGFLVAIWLADVQTDYAGRRQSQWRAATATWLRRNGTNWNPCTKGKLSENSPQGRDL